MERYFRKVALGTVITVALLSVLAVPGYFNASANAQPRVPADFTHTAVMAEVSNVALGKTGITVSCTPPAQLSILTDGVTTTNPYINLPKSPQWIQLDLEDFFDISRVNLRHYYSGGRKYHDVIIQLSQDGLDWTTVFNNDANNSAGQGTGSDAEYAETAAGKNVNLSTPVKARLVRCWSNGNSINAYNHYVELEVYGIPGAAGDVNQAPAVNAGPDATITFPDGATLDGTASDDGLPDGTLITTWSQVSGPGTVTFADPSSTDTVATIPAPGVYVLRLTASDGQLSSHDDVRITVNTNATEVSNTALGKTGITVSCTPPAQLSILTDGVTTTSPYINMPKSPQWVQLDLEGLFDISRVNLRHYYSGGRKYHDVIIQLSQDGLDWTTVFNNDANNSAGQGTGSDAEYAETAAGKNVNLSTPVKARLVRCWSNGNSINAYNHYVELEVYCILGTAGAASALSFEDVAASAGLAGPLTGAYIHAASWGDIDGDGWLDLFTGTFVEAPALVPNRLFKNEGGTFVDISQPAISLNGSASGSVFADLDNDGDLDLYISNYKKIDGPGPVGEPSHIYRNDGGVFVDKTDGSGIGAQSGHGRQVGVLDYNHDGLLDLFVVADSLGGQGPTVLLRNMGNFVFEDATSAAGLPTDIHGLGLAIGDVTGDGWPDIFVAGGAKVYYIAQDDSNYLFIANGDGTYHRFGGKVFDWGPFIYGTEDWTSGAAFGDLNRDGRLDLLVGHHFGSAVELSDGVPLRVYMNRGLDINGDPVFEDLTIQLGLPKIDSKSPHVEIQDFNNDGWPDLYTSVRIDTDSGYAPLIFLNQGAVGGDPAFTWPDIVNPHYYAAGPVADFDNDGRLDVFFAEWRSVLGTPVTSMLMKNISPSRNWLEVRVDDGANRWGVGAKVKVYREGMSSNPVGLLGFVEICPSQGFSSSQPSIAHFGLGDETRVDVVVEMPFGGAVYSQNSVPANQLIIMPVH